MRIVFLCALVLGCACAQYVKSGVKGGYGGRRFQEHAGENLVSLFGNNTQRTAQVNATLQAEGICFKEVPTVSLVKDPRHVPAGNGSRPDLSVVRSCCPGYEKNIHNPKLCDPVCNKECVNSICTAPETCTCYPDHVRNFAGECVPTCPIGCQHGQCAGGECICNSGFVLDLDGKFCIPTCKDNCGGMGTCTSHNICSCRPGYQPTPEGSCKPACDRACGHREVCVAPNTCGPATQLIPGQGPYQPYNQVPNPGYPGQRNQTTVPYYPGNGPNQNSTQFIPPYYPQNHPYNTYPGQNAVYPGQDQYPNQYPGGYQPNYFVQPGGFGTYGPPPSDNLFLNTTTNASRPDQPNQPGNHQHQPGHHGHYPGHHGYYPGHHSNHPGHHSNLSEFPLNGPGFQPNQQGYLPNQPGYQPNQPGYRPNEPVYQPNQPGYQPNQPGYQPNQPGYQPNQPGYQPQYYPGYYPGNQPGYYPGNQPGYYPGNQPGNYPGFQPGYQPSQYPPPGLIQPNQTNHGYTPNYNAQHIYYPPNSSFPYQFYPGQPTFRPGLYYDPMYLNPYFNPNKTGNGQNPYQQNATLNQPLYPQPNNVNASNVPSYPGSENLTSHQVYPSQHSPPNGPNNPNPTQGPQPTHEHTTTRSPDLYNPFKSEYNQQNVQQFVCSPSCINGDCVEDNRCSCHRGYVLDNSDPSGVRCKPVCVGGCMNGECAAPNVCVCNEGYHMDTGVKGRTVCIKRIRRSADLAKKPSAADF